MCVSDCACVSCFSSVNIMSSLKTKNTQKRQRNDIWGNSTATPTTTASDSNVDNNNDADECKRRKSYNNNLHQSWHQSTSSNGSIRYKSKQELDEQYRRRLYGISRLVELEEACQERNRDEGYYSSN